MVDLAGTLRGQQFEFARHLRDPSMNAAPPGIEDRRLAVYRELFYNNIQDLLAGNFPVIRKTLEDDEWDALIHAFHAGHRCSTPLFTEIGREFISFLESREADSAAPWLAELAHYEWVELALQIADDALPAHDPCGDLLEGSPVVSPTAWPLAYRWPVQRIGPHYRPMIAPEQPTLLLVHRDHEGMIHFAEISPLVYRLLERLGEMSPLSGHDTLVALAQEANAGDVPQFVRDGASMLQRFHEEATIVGTRLSPK